MPQLRRGKWAVPRPAHRVHLGGRQDVVLGGLGLGTAALGTTCRMVELPVLGGSMDLGHLEQDGGWAGMLGTHRLPAAPTQAPTAGFCGPLP